MHGVLQRKCACGTPKPGGGTCASCAGEKEGGLQRKLPIGSSNDPLEHEADRIAEQVLSKPGPSGVGAAPLRIQRATAHASEPWVEVPASVGQVLGSSGRALDAGARLDMEQRFGHDFSQVRVHNDAAAGQSASDVHAKAYTVGTHIVFGANQFSPETTSGRRLLAHELSHVLQQADATPQMQRDPLPDLEYRSARERSDDWSDAGDQEPKAAKKDAKKGKAAPQKNPCTREILAEGTCQHLVDNSRFRCCDPKNGLKNTEKSIDVDGNECASQKFTPIFTCDSTCVKALAKRCDDNDNWMAIPSNQFTRGDCGKEWTVCANGKFTKGYVRDKSETKTKFEVSPGIQATLGVSGSFMGGMYKPGASQKAIDADPCCKKP